MPGLVPGSREVDRLALHREDRAAGRQLLEQHPGLESMGVLTDVRDSAEVDAALARTADELGTVSILINNAGGVFSSAILDTSENGRDALYRANLRHVLLCTQHVARQMVASGIGGSITNVTSPIRRHRQHGAGDAVLRSDALSSPELRCELLVRAVGAVDGLAVPGGRAVGRARHDRDQATRWLSRPSAAVDALGVRRRRACPATCRRARR